MYIYIYMYGYIYVYELGPSGFLCKFFLAQVIFCLGTWTDRVENAIANEVAAVINPLLF